MSQDTMLQPGQIIGIIGGGQLGRMLCVSAAKLGFKTHIFTPIAACPAAQLANFVTVGTGDNEEAFVHFARQVDVITFEFENISLQHIASIARLSNIYPDPKILEIARDRRTEKSFLNDLGVPTAPWCIPGEWDEHRKTMQFPVIVKTAREGYDGKGQFGATNEEELGAILEKLAPNPLVIEQKVPFISELSVMVVRGLAGEIYCFDPTQNIHKNGILDVSIAPAPYPKDILAKLTDTAKEIARALNLVGILGIEFFLTEDGQLRVNEMAPRPHNSGHWTMDGCFYDQFDMHIRAITGLPLMPPKRHHDVIMKNLVGLDAYAQYKSAVQRKEYIPYLYGKTEARPGRKMGHVNIPLAYDSLPGAHMIADLLAPFKTHK